MHFTPHTLHCTALHCTVLRCTTRHDATRHDTTRHDNICYNTTSARVLLGAGEGLALPAIHSMIQKLVFSIHTCYFFEVHSITSFRTPTITTSLLNHCIVIPILTRSSVTHFVLPHSLSLLHLTLPHLDMSSPPNERPVLRLSQLLVTSAPC